MLDFHNHLIPGVDDGSASLQESLVALERMSAQGITHIITTPHFSASTVTKPQEFESQMTRIDESWGILYQAANAGFPQMKLYRGVELALDDPNPIVRDPRLRLAGTRFILVEFPYFAIPLNSVQALQRLKASGVTPIVAHPERYENLLQPFEVLRAWKRAGAFLQLNAGSIVGSYGPRVERRAWYCLESGLVDYVSSDYHARGKCLLAAARERLEGRGGAGQFKVLAEYNGDRLTKGLDPTPVAPLARPKSRWDRLKHAFGRH